MQLRSGALALALCLLSTTAAATVTGTARVIDGDTLAIGATHIRLFGIDAPEKRQTCLSGHDTHDTPYACGQVAAEALRQMIGGRPVTCDSRGLDRYGRTIAVCSVAGIGDLGQQLVARGLAVAYVRYSKRYLADQAAAQLAHRGLWAGQFAMPWDWRKVH